MAVLLVVPLFAGVTFAEPALAASTDRPGVGDVQTPGVGDVQTGAVLPLHDATGSAIHVDCGSAPGGDGSIEAPFDSLEAVNAVPLKSGDAVLFKRGSTCTGVFAPQGSGSADAPITVESYGDSQVRPVIDGAGAYQALLLHNVSHWVVRDLELVNDGPGEVVRYGLVMSAQDVASAEGTGSDGVMEDIAISNTVIRDVLYTPGVASSGSPWLFSQGVLAVVKPSLTAGNPKPVSRIRGITFENNTVKRAMSGFVTWTDFCRRPQLSNWAGRCSQDFAPISDVALRANDFREIGGNGVVLNTTTDATVSHNKLDGFNLEHLGAAGMWEANSDRISFDHNEVSGGRKDPGNYDVMAFDADQGSRDIVFEYNFSHDNDGGAYLVCPENSLVNAQFRFNLSVNDHTRVFRFCHANTLSNVNIENNTVIIDERQGAVSSVIGILDGSYGDPDRIGFRNNIIVNRGGADVVLNVGTGKQRMDNNLLWGIPEAQMPPIGAGNITADPQFLSTEGDAPASFQLREGSPALGSAMPALQAATKDYFGDAVTEPGSIGFAGRGVKANGSSACTPTVAFTPTKTRFLGGATGTREVIVSNGCGKTFTHLRLIAEDRDGVTAGVESAEIAQLKAGESRTLAVTIDATQASAVSHDLRLRLENQQGDLLDTGAASVIVGAPAATPWIVTGGASNRPWETAAEGGQIALGGGGKNINERVTAYRAGALPSGGTATVTLEDETITGTTYASQLPTAGILAANDLSQSRPVGLIIAFVSSRNGCQVSVDRNGDGQIGAGETSSAGAELFSADQHVTISLRRASEGSFEATCERADGQKATFTGLRPFGAAAVSDAGLFWSANDAAEKTGGHAVFSGFEIH